MPSTVSDSTGVSRSLVEFRAAVRASLIEHFSSDARMCVPGFPGFVFRCGLSVARAHWLDGHTPDRCRAEVAWLVEVSVALPSATVH